MAQKLLEHALAKEDAPLNALNVISTGVSAFSNQPVSNNSVEALKKVGLDLTDHRSQQLTQEQMNSSLAVLCMTESHRSLVKMSFDVLPENLFLMRELIPNVDDSEIPDPFGQNLHAYENCRDSMVEAIPHIVKFIKENYEG